MIVLRQLTLARGGRNLLEDVDLTLHDRTRVGMIGANGSGKSSFFALLRGELHQESGDLDMPPRLTIAHVAQETPAAPAPAIEYVIDGDAELREIERSLRLPMTRITASVWPNFMHASTPSTATLPGPGPRQ